MKTTEIYTHVMNKDLNAVQNPLDRLKLFQCLENFSEYWNFLCIPWCKFFQTSGFARHVGKSPTHDNKQRIKQPLSPLPIRCFLSFAG